MKKIKHKSKLTFVEERKRNQTVMSVNYCNNKAHNIILTNHEMDPKKRMLSVLESGGGIDSTGDIFSMLEMNGSSSFSCQYRRGCKSIYDTIYDEVRESLKDEIRTTLACEKGVKYYNDWLKKPEEYKEIVELTGSYDAGWQRAVRHEI